MTQNDQASPPAADNNSGPVRERLKRRRSAAFFTVDVPEFGQLRVRRLATREVLEISKKKDNSSLELVVKSAVDENGNPLFGSLEELNTEDWPLVQLLMKACGTVNSLSEAVEEAAKNLQAHG